MSLQSFAVWLDQTPMSVAIKSNAFTIPLAQSLHILAVAFVFSGALLLVLRSYALVGVDWPVAQWSAKLERRFLLALTLLAISGSLLVLAEPTRELLNRVFQVKLLLVVLTVPLAIWLGRRQSALQESADLGTLGRGIGLFLLFLWIAIISAGRWIAYV